MGIVRDPVLGPELPKAGPCRSQQVPGKRCYQTPTLKQHPSWWCDNCVRSVEGQAALQKHYQGQLD